MAIDDKVTAALKKLRDYCESENYKGWDPYDGLNSKVYRAIPLLKRSAMWRLCVIQGFKRCPVNLRPMLRVPKEHNAKGVGLFLQGYCNLHNAVKAKPELADVFGTPDELKAKINEVAEL
ncbi:MAG: delta-aminolevulinic acid dehydratase, partial [Muribaculaceae bacterium]|nr:delta-aminolevulinic acid dehydratase [Muribaculaceae bacterium]